MWRKLIFIVAFTIAHWTATMIIVFVSLGTAMQGMDGGPLPSPARELVLKTLFSVFTFPALLIIPWFQDLGLFGHVWFVLNSALWGVVVLGAHAVWRRRTRLIAD